MGQKRRKAAGKWPKLAKNRPKMDVTENEQKWPKMAENGPKMDENGRKWPTMAKNGYFLVILAIVDHFWSFLPIFPNFDLFLTFF